MSTAKIAVLYGAVLHICGLAALTVLVAIGKVPSAEGLPLIAGLLGVGVGVAVTPNSTPEPSGAVLVRPGIPAPPAPVVTVTAPSPVNAMPTNQA